MGYYIRFLIEDGRPLSLEKVIDGLRTVDPGFALTGGKDLTRSGELVAELDIAVPGDGIFEDDIGLLRERAGSAGGAAVAARIASVTAILTARVLCQDRDAEETLDLLDPLWEWLTANRRGLVHADGEGFYDQEELILETR